MLKQPTYWNIKWTIVKIGLFFNLFDMRLSFHLFASLSKWISRRRTSASLPFNYRSTRRILLTIQMSFLCVTEYLDEPSTEWEIRCVREHGDFLTSSSSLFSLLWSICIFADWWAMFAHSVFRRRTRTCLPTVIRSLLSDLRHLIIRCSSCREISSCFSRTKRSMNKHLVVFLSL